MAVTAHQPPPAIRRPPRRLDESTRRALGLFKAALQRQFGPRLVSVRLFGSRARGDHHPDSDADVAVVLAGGDPGWEETRQAIDAGSDILVATGLYIQPWIFGDAEAPERHDGRRQRLLESIQAEGIDL